MIKFVEVKKRLRSVFYMRRADGTLFIFGLFTGLKPGVTKLNRAYGSANKEGAANDGECRCRASVQIVTPGFNPVDEQR